MKNKIFLIILLFISAGYNTNAQEVTKQDSTKNEHHSDLKLFPLNNDKIRQMPFRTINQLSMLNPSVYYLKGGRMFYYGIEVNGDNIFIDGMQVNDCNEFPFRSIGSYNFYGLTSPINMGNSLSGFIDIQSLEVGDKLSLNIELNKEIKKYYKDYLVEFNLGIPFNFNKNGTTKNNPSLFIAGNFYATNNTDPIWEDSFIINPDALEHLKNNPLRPSGLATGGTFQNAEFVNDDDIYICQPPQNARKVALNYFSKIKIPIGNNIELTLGNYTKIENSDKNIFDNALFNSSNNPERQVMNFDNYLKFEHKIKVSENLNIKYQVHLQYSNYYTKLQSRKHQDRFFEYGYLGKFQTYKTPSFEMGNIIIDSIQYQNVWIQNSWDYDTLVEFTPFDYNPFVANYTSNYYDFCNGQAAGNYQNTNQIQLGGGLLNGQNPPSVYGLWNSIGDQSPYRYGNTNNSFARNFDYMENSEEKIRGTLGFEANYKSHHFTAGFEYLKEIKRYYSLNPNMLWSLMRGFTNFHLLELDTDNPIMVYDNGVFQDSVLFYRKYDAFSQRTFDINLRKKLGLAIGGLDFIIIDSYDMVNRTIDYYDRDGVMHTIQLTDDLYSLDMFSADELYKYDNSIQYQGYDYTGNIITNKQSPYDFYTNRTIDAFRPVYMSAYLNDKFSWKNINISIGLRIDRYDANQPVLKDKYSLMEIFTVGDLRENNSNLSIPEVIGDDYFVYVDSYNNPSYIEGYRDNDKWYDNDGREISDPSILSTPEGIIPYLKYPDIYLGGTGWEPDMTFKDYEPVINFLPQINIDFNLQKTTNIYFSYNTYTQNPNYYNQFRPGNYLFFNYDPEEIFPNPDLKPVRMEKLNIGVKKPIYKRVFADVSFLMTFLKNNYYVGKIIGGYPHDYYTILNDNDNIINKGLIASINYFSPKSSGLNFSVSVTKFFPDEDDFNYAEISDLVVNSFAGFSFGEGNDYFGPVIGNWKMLEKFSLSCYYQFRKGTYSASYYGASFKRTPNFNMLNMKLEKEFYIKNRIGINVYLLIENLLNFKNVFYVYPKTGQPDDDGYLSDPVYQQQINNQICPESFITLYKLKLINPRHYDIPRIVRLGCILHF
ncbi:MAG: hypothetical protein K8R41_05465 [Bacteroidales bacterium]|nr:hypothetical protein [Bacteroidales bacterium]